MLHKLYEILYLLPNVVGKTYNDACMTLSRMGLKYDLTEMVKICM